MDNQPASTATEGTIENEEVFEMAQTLLASEAAGTRSAVVKEEIEHLIKKKRRISCYREPKGNEGVPQEIDTVSCLSFQTLET